MARTRNLRPSPDSPLLVRAATAFDVVEGGDDEQPAELVVEVPDDLSALDDEALAQTLDDALEAFRAVEPADDEQVTAEALEQMEALAAAIERLRAERDSRAEEAAQRQAAAAALAERVAEPEGASGDGDDESAEGDGTPHEEAEEEEDDEPTAEEPAEEQPQAVAEREREPVAASGSRAVSLTVAPRRRVEARSSGEQSREVVFRGTGGGRTDGQALRGESLAEQVMRRANSVSVASIEAARSRGQHFSQRVGTALIQRSEQPGFDPRLVIDDRTDPAEVIAYAVNEARLPGGSLTAAGTGWCAPSEVLYDIFDCGSTPGAGVVSLPEVQFARGGIVFEPAINFGDVAEVDGFFFFNETQAIAGDYDNQGSASDKPCYAIDCGTPEEVRLEVLGLCFTADILARRTRPERIERILELALAVHQRRVSDARLAAMWGSSTAVTQPAGQVGAAAPTLGFLELQVEYLRQKMNLDETATVEAILPHWARGVMRADLSRRLGVDLLDVSNAQVDALLAQRGISAQYVYGWQSLGNTPPTEWPTTMEALLYPAGTWVAGTSDIIEIDTLYDSTLLKQNKYTALFVEEGWAVFNRGCESLAATLNVCADGATHGGIDIACDGTEVTAP